VFFCEKNDIKCGSGGGGGGGGGNGHFVKSHKNVTLYGFPFEECGTVNTLIVTSSCLFVLGRRKRSGFRSLSFTFVQSRVQTLHSELWIYVSGANWKNCVLTTEVTFLAHRILLVELRRQYPPSKENQTPVPINTQCKRETDGVQRLSYAKAFTLVCLLTSSNVLTHWSYQLLH